MIELLNKEEYDECMRFATQIDSAMFIVEELENDSDEFLSDEDYEALVWEAGKLLAQARRKVENVAKKYIINTADFITTEGG